MKTLPYRAWTATGDTFDIAFPLHPETQDAVRVGQIVSALLDAVDRDIALQNSAGSAAAETSNGDVLQAFAMAMAVRGRMIHAPQEVIEKLSADLLRMALEAVAQAGHTRPPSGSA